MSKYVEIRAMETKDKSEIGKIFLYLYEEATGTIKNQIKDGPCKDFVEQFKEDILGKITLQPAPLLATGKKQVFGNISEQSLKWAQVIQVDSQIADILLHILSQMFHFSQMW